MIHQLLKNNFGIPFIAWAILLWSSAMAQANMLEFIVDRGDGQIFIKNPSSDAITLDGYQIESFDSALSIAGWTPIAGNYDLSGDQSVDANADWIILGTPNSMIAAEASLESGTGQIAPGQIVSLGLFFNTTLNEGGVVEVSSDTTTETLFPDFRTLTADYDNDLDVDRDDYDVFTATYGSMIDLRADGNGDNVINAADYTVWRDSPELNLSSTTGGRAVTFTIPEPTTFVGLMAGLLTCLLASSRQRCRPPRAAW